MKALITGGAGFLGSHLADRLITEGFSVIALDSLQTGSQRNIEHLKDNKGFVFKKHDVVRPYNEKCDWLFNMACPASPVHYQKDPLRTMRTSVLGADHACINALANNARLMQASTSEVYGDPKISPQKEEYWGHVNPVGERSCYDEGKRAAETICMDYHKCKGMNLRLVRIFNTYGPRMHPEDGRVVSNFIVQALRGEDITIYGDGQQTRSFCYVDDLIEGFWQMMRQENTVGPINLGNPGEFTMLELAELVLKLTESKSKLVYKPLPSDDPKQRKPDLTKAKENLGDWEPKVPLEEGLKRTIEYFKTVI